MGAERLRAHPAVGADRTLSVALTEYHLNPQSARVGAGTLTILVRNYGRLTHNLVISMNGQPTASTRPPGPGQSTTITVSLTAGSYQMASTILSDQALGEYGTLDRHLLSAGRRRPARAELLASPGAGQQTFAPRKCAIVLLRRQPEEPAPGLYKRRDGHRPRSGRRATGPDPEQFREVFGRFATGVAVITSSGPAGAGGMTANAICSLSLNPLLALVCFENQARTLPIVREAGRFAVNILSAEQSHLAGVFASKLPEAEKLDGVDHRLEHGVPMIEARSPGRSASCAS